MSEKDFLKAYDQYYNDIYKFLLYRVFDKEKARDLSQDVFLKAWDYIAKGNKIDKIRPFLYKTARNLVIDYSRKKKEVSLDGLLNEGFQFEDKKGNRLEEKVDSTLLLKTIDKIDSDLKGPLLLRYVADLKPKEIAEILDINTNLVSVRIHRGIQKVKNSITNDR